MQHVSLKTFVLCLMASLGLVMAQGLPLSLQGQGNQRTEVFYTFGTWTAKVIATGTVYLYLYDANNSQNLQGLLSGDLLSFEGNYFLFIKTDNPSTNWSVLISNDLTASPTNLSSSPLAVTSPVAPSSSPTTYTRPPSSPSTDLYNCSDFDGQAEAQAFFLRE